MKRPPVRIPLVFLVLLLTATVARSQVDVHVASLAVGQIRGLSWDGDGLPYVVYPELQLGGRWFVPVLEWSAYWGYWDDGIDRVRVSDAMVYSMSGHIIGGRIVLLPGHGDEHWPLPLGFMAGAARHMAARHYVGGSDGLGTPVRNDTESATVLELGARLYWTLSKTVELRAEGHQYFRTGDTGLARQQSGRRSYTIGIAGTF